MPSAEFTPNRNNQALVLVGAAAALAVAGFLGIGAHKLQAKLQPSFEQIEQGSSTQSTNEFTEPGN